MVFSQNLFYADIVLLMPEFFFVTSILFLLPIGVAYNHIPLAVGPILSVQIVKLAIGVLFFFLILLINHSDLEYSFFGGQYSRDSLSYFFYFFSILGVLSLCFFSLVYFQLTFLSEFEVPLIFLLVLCGNLFIILSNDFLSLYVGIELQSLGLYILGTLKNNSTFSTEAGLKYFVLGAFASSLLIFGVCLFYGFTGSIQFTDNFILLCGTSEIFSKGLSFSLFFIFSGLLFKLGGAPFHVWVPDVYEGAPTLVTGFFSIVPKIAILSIFVKLSYGVLYFFDNQMLFLLSYSSFLSIFIGSVGALGQFRLKRLIAYSAIGHSGFFLLSLASMTFNSIVSVCLYLVIYLVLLINVFGIILGSLDRSKGSTLKIVQNLRYLYQSNPIVGIMLISSFFGIAGIPPISGFFSKFFVFFCSMSGDLYFLSVFCILLSIIGSVYYLRLIRSTLFLKNETLWVFFYKFSGISCYIYGYTFIFSVCFFLIVEGLVYLVSDITLLYLF